MEWQTADRFLSNNGRGPLVARILCVAAGMVTMERWHKNGKTKTRFQLPEWFLKSESCGWRIRR